MRLSSSTWITRNITFCYVLRGVVYRVLCKGLREFGWGRKIFCKTLFLVPLLVQILFAKEVKFVLYKYFQKLRVIFQIKIEFDLYEKVMIEKKCPIKR